MAEVRIRVSDRTTSAITRNGNNVSTVMVGGDNENGHDPNDDTGGTMNTTGGEVLLAPPESEWYHGRLDRVASEERLRSFRDERTGSNLGSYLVRESDRKPGSYVLSYLGKTGFNHFRVTAVCGDFYIGGRQFDSLQDLIGYYMHKSDLLKHERLVVPVPPPSPVNDRKRMMAILPYTKMPDTDELTFQKADIFFIHNDLGDGWLWVTAHRTGEQGLVFRDLLADLDETIDPNAVFPWFHPNLTKSEAVEMLVRGKLIAFCTHGAINNIGHFSGGPGSFLVRPSDNSPGDYSLFFHINNQIQRFRIEKKGVRYVMGGRTFDCLEAVINRYKTEQIVEGHTLGHHIRRVSISPHAFNAYNDVDKVDVAPYLNLKRIQWVEKLIETF